MTTLQQIYWSTSPMMRSDEVWKAQSLLAMKGASVRADGIYGKQTSDAVRAFQARSNLKGDGVLGPLTWAALNGDAPPATVPNGADEILTPAHLAELTQPHRRYPGSVTWSLTRDGLAVGGTPIPFADGEYRLVVDLLNAYKTTIASIVPLAPVPVELVIATICAESSGKVEALRYEPGCDRNVPEHTPGRVSMGLMQTLLSTARDVLDQPGLRVADLAQPATSIRAGMYYIWRQARRTGFDPPVVAAAYNAGSVLYNGGADNRWRLKQYPIGTGNHVDRFTRYFNAAMRALVLGEVTLAAGMPAFVQMVGGARAAPAQAPAPVAGGGTADTARIPDLIAQGISEQGLAQARAIGVANLDGYPTNGCAVHLSALLRQAAIDVPLTFSAGKLASTIAARGWSRIDVGGQAAGDVGVCFDNDPTRSGADHIYLVVQRIDDDQMQIADNQQDNNMPHARSASGKPNGKTPTKYFLRA